ncbi:MAG TPA: CocE/NonD family hydrolase [Gaiellaceae bacterium]|nr:CocE/NonD family hydrolase [Gaiellaceae bacterium]
MSGFSRGAVLAVLATVAALVASSPAGAFSRQDVTIASADGTSLAATLTLPDAPAPTGGWPALVFMHGLGQNRAAGLAVAQAMEVGERYAVLAFDARGHGDSGGMIGIDGPKEVADVRAVFGWLRNRPDVADARIGGWGVSYGGGGAWNSLVAGVPWAALEISMSWTDLRQALVPQGLAKTGVIAGFLGALDPKRVDPEVFALRDAAYAGRLEAVGPFAAARSSLSALKGVRTPVFMMQGRRDFAFGLEHALGAYRALSGPKQLWIGLHGHAPSSGIAPDTPAMLAEGARWFDRFLRGDTAAPLPKPVAISSERWKGQPTRFAAVPKTVVRRASRFAIRATGRAGIAQGGRYRIPVQSPNRATEVFGSPTVDVTANATSGWSRIVAVLSARTPVGKEIVVAGGGVPARPGKRTYRIALGSQATFLPKGSKLTLTIGSSSLAQSPGNLLYLDLPFSAGARLVVIGGKLRVPELATPVTR